MLVGGMLQGFNDIVFNHTFVRSSLLHNRNLVCLLLVPQKCLGVSNGLSCFVH